MNKTLVALALVLALLLIGCGKKDDAATTGTTGAATAGASTETPPASK